MPSFEPGADVQIKSVLVAFDFSEASHKALSHALAIARHYGAKFYLVHVVASIGYTIAGPESLALSIEKTRRDAQELEQELLKSGALADLRYEFIVHEGNVCSEVERITSEKQVDLVVIGTHGRGGLGKFLLGSTAEQVFRHSHSLVMTVGPASYKDSPVQKSQTQTLHPFLFATDFGEASLKALPYAISFANHFAARLVLLHVLPAAPIPEGFHWSTAGDLMQMREKAQLESESRLDELVKRATPRATSKPECLVRFGIPSDQILLAAHSLSADLIILGLRHTSHIETASHMPWALAYRVVCGARCSVLTIRK